MKASMNNGRHAAEREGDRNAGEQRGEGGAAIEQPDLQRAHTA